MTLLVRGDSLEKSMSRYLIEQIATQVEHRALFALEVVGGARRRVARGDRHPRSRDGRDDAGTSRGGLFVFIGADADTGWLPAEIARDERGYVLTGDDVSSRRTLGARPRSLPARDQRAGRVRLRRRAVGPVKRVAAAVGEGSMAIAFVHQYLREAADVEAVVG